MGRLFSQAIALTFIVQLVMHIASGIIILDRGNPARFIRGAFLDENQNQPEITSLTSASDLLHDKDFEELAQKPGFMQTLAATIATELNSFVKSMTHAMVVEAQEVTARSALNMCQMARAKMNALQIMNTLQAVTVQIASVGFNQAEMEATEGNLEVIMFNSVMDNISTAFQQMEEDLHQYDPAKHGEAPMQHFGQAFKDFNALQVALTLNE